jgi:uncharacterized protein YndB with AHSA1/START domain
MTRIFSSIVIRRPVEQVFDFVTKPGNWPQWHPSSLGVSGATDHSLEPGEQVTEKFRVAGGHGVVVWTVIERQAPRRWVIRGEVDGRRGGGTITYNLKDHPQGTNFEREFVYEFKNPLLAFLDRLLIHHKIEEESSKALQQLKQVMEI